MVDWYTDTYWLARFAYLRVLGLIYLVAFMVAVNQFRALLGERGLEPVPFFLKFIPFRRSPSLFHLAYSDRLFAFAAWVGVLLSLLAVFGLTDLLPLWAFVLIWFLLWVLYLSIVNVGQTFYGFGWESILLEAGFLAIFLGPARYSAPFIIVLLIRWLLFRVEFGAGLIKLRGDPCWRDLTCMNYHYETQPLPNPVSWYAHRLPHTFHKISALGNYFAQLVAPPLLFAPQPVASLAGIIMILTQLWLVLTGNFAWLNYLTITLALTSISDQVVGAIIPIHLAATQPRPPLLDQTILILALATVLMSIQPVLNMLSPNQVMNKSYNPLHLVSTYGAFGSINRQRFEVILEGTSQEILSSETHWKEYEFKGKPGDLSHRPPLVAPYHWRLDWQIWFLPFYSQVPNWFLVFVERLLENDPQILKLMSSNPFPNQPPKYIRARLYHYRFSTFEEKSKSGLWWRRSLAEEYLSPVSLKK